MTQPAIEKYTTFIRMMRLYCNANRYDIDALKKQVSKPEWQSLNPGFRQEFKEVIDEHIVTVEEFERLTDVEFENEDELYDELRAIFARLYSND